MMNNRERARKSIIKHLVEIEDDDVLRSIILIMGDYKLNENGEKRARCITEILFKIISCKKLETLDKIHIVARTFAGMDAKGGAYNA